jgi:hypothetical protein
MIINVMWQERCVIIYALHQALGHYHDQIKEYEMSEACSTHGAMRDAYTCRVMVGKSEAMNTF